MLVVMEVSLVGDIYADDMMPLFTLKTDVVQMTKQQKPG